MDTVIFRTLDGANLTVDRATADAALGGQVLYPGADGYAYGANYERLVDIKQRFDPDNLFRANQNIDGAREMRRFTHA